MPILAIGGGSAFMAMRDEESGRFLWRALELGLTYWDTAHSYGNGESEKRMGRVLKTERKWVFLATKTAASTYGDAMRQVELSLNGKAQLLPSQRNGTRERKDGDESDAVKLAAHFPLRGDGDGSSGDGD